MKNFLFTLVAFLLMPCCAHAQKSRTIILVGRVADSFTGMAVPGAKVTMMTADSTVVDSTEVMTFDTEGVMQESIFSFTETPAKPARYIFKAECDGYETAYTNYDLRRPGRNTRIDMPTIAMKKSIVRERTLGEVAVTATKVKVVHRGDTLVFNADAFNVADGSMLDGLISQMPGVELKRDGEILVNGKKIDYMLLNGKDFYRGNNRLMLENLPYYMVQDVKVYNRATDRAAYAGLDSEKKDFVMDVNMKRQYRQGYMANAEAGGGTGDTWLARLFGLRFTDHSRLSLIGNANNVNAEYNIDNQGYDRGDGENRDGRDTRKTLSAGLWIDSKSWSNNLETTVGWHKAVTRQKAYAETLHDSDTATYSSSFSDGTADRFGVTARNEFALKAPFYLRSTTALSYDDDNSVSTSSYESQPSNQMLRTTSRGHDINLSQTLAATHKLAWGDVLDLDLSFAYSDGSKHADEQRLVTTLTQRQDMMQSPWPSADERLVTASHPRHGYDYKVGASYSVNDFHHGTWQLQLSYGQDYRSEEERRTDLLTGTADDNSHSLAELTRTYRGALRYAYSRYSPDGSSYSSLELLAPLRRVEWRSLYRQAWLDTCAARRAWLFEPTAEWERGWKSFDITLYASFVKEMPDITSLVTVPNTIDPLNTFLGNPRLKNPGTLKGGVKFLYEPSGQLLRLFASWKRMFNQITQTYDYDPATGHYTFTPENVSGNWVADYTAFYSHRLGKDSPFWIAGENNGDFGRTHNLGWRVSFLNMSQKANISYDKDGTRLILHAEVAWQHATSTAVGASDVNAKRYGYGLQAICRLPWKLSLDTDISMTHRRGYDTPALNTDNCSWNMTVGRGFLKGERLLVRVTAFDILHDYSAVTEAVTAAGRTETWRKTLPAYWMLRVGYKLNVNPKK